MSRYQKCKANLDFTEARDSKWQWHQLGCMQVCTLLQTENYASTLSLRFLQAGCLSCRPTNRVKALKAINRNNKKQHTSFKYTQLYLANGKFQAPGGSILDTMFKTLVFIKISMNCNKHNADSKYNALVTDTSSYPILSLRSAQAPSLASLTNMSFFVL